MVPTMTSTTRPNNGSAHWDDVGDLVGRILLASIFVMGGADKLFGHTAQTVEMMDAHHVPLSAVLVYPAGIAELAGGLALALGFRTRLAAMVLALFTLVVTPIFHAFWAVPADQALNQMLFFTKNLALFGGLVYVAAHGSARFALQRN